MATQTKSAVITVSSFAFTGTVQTLAAAQAVLGHAGVISGTKTPVKGNRWNLTGTLDPLLDQTELEAELNALAVIANLSITIDVDKATAAEGEDVTTTITVTNNSTIYLVEDVVATVTYEAGWTETDDTPPVGTTYTEPTWTIGTLDPGESVVLTTVIDADAATSGSDLDIDVSVTGTTTDATAADDTDSETVSIS